MDILVSSNLERLLFLLSGDGDLVAKLMAELKETGAYEVPAALKEKIAAIFWGGCCDDEKTAEAIGKIYADHGYLADTHTAVAWHVAQEYKAACPHHNPVVILSTASPYKFPVAVWEGLGKAAQEDEFAVMDDLCRATGVPIPKNLQGLQEKEVRHRDVIKKEDMLSYVLGKVKEDAWKK